MYESMDFQIDENSMQQKISQYAFDYRMKHVVIERESKIW